MRVSGRWWKLLRVKSAPTASNLAPLGVSMVDRARHAVLGFSVSLRWWTGIVKLCRRVTPSAAVFRLQLLPAAGRRRSRLRRLRLLWYPYATESIRARPPPKVRDKAGGSRVSMLHRPMEAIPIIGRIHMPTSRIHHLRVGVVPSP